MLICGGLLAASAASGASREFERGVAASRRGDFQQAVRHFENARDEGLDTPALHHNLGVAYFELGRYELARQAFERAARTPEMRALSFYNLGRVALEAGDEEAARDWFRRAYEGARTDRLRRLAAARLGLEERVATPYRLYVEGFGGYDSNPGLVSDDVGELAVGDDEEDAVFGALVSGRYLLVGDWGYGLTVRGTGYADLHPDLDDEDFATLTGGFGLHASPGGWRHEIDLVASQLWLGREALQTEARAGLRTQRRLGRRLAAELWLRSHYVDGASSNGFDYLTGWRHVGRARLLGRLGAWFWRTHYELQLEDRDDLRVESAAGTDFFSVSPIRHEVAASLERPLIAAWSGTVGGGLRHSAYRDDEIRGGVARGERRDDRWEVALGVFGPLWGDWIGRIEGTYWDSASDCDAAACERFDYDRIEVLISVGRSF